MLDFQGRLSSMKRLFYAEQIKTALKRAKIAVITGPRQCGKTTIARRFVSEKSINYFDLEDPVSLQRLKEPMTELSRLKGVVVIDEVQRMPTLFPILRVLADRKSAQCRFLLLGSVAPEMMRNVSETLAGRTETIELTPFSSDEILQKQTERLWLRGGFPSSFLAHNEKDSFSWRKNYIDTLLRLDLSLLGLNLSPETMHRFWYMLAHCHANIWNAADPARSLGISETTVRRYLDALTGIYMIRQLKPWHENLSKRQVKAPKIYFRDSGLLHVMLGVESRNQLYLHPRLGASWEGFIIETLLHRNRDTSPYYWSTYSGAELDLLLIKGNKRIGYEIKRSDAPSLTASMRIAFSDLKLQKLYVVYPGKISYALARNIEVISANSLFA